MPDTVNKPTPAAGTEAMIERRQQASMLQIEVLQNAILTSANFSIIATDEKGVIQLFNIGAESMLGYAATDVLNKITPAEISDSQEIIARAQALSGELETPIKPGFEALVFKASRGIEDIYELTYVRKNGSRFPAVVSVTALHNDQGGIIGYLLISTDNTARKRAEEKFAVTLNSIADAVIATDAEARVTLLNPLAEQLTGFTQAQASGRPVNDIFHIINKETRQESTIPVMETLANGTIQGLGNHTVLIARDGSECDIADSCAPIRDHDGQVIGAVLVFRDVTHEYAVQQALRDQQFYTRSLIESSIDALMTTDPSGIITDVNEQMVVLTGCARDELIGTAFKNYFTDPARAEAGIKRVLNEKKVRDYELTVRHKHNKEAVVVSYNAATFYDADGRLQGVFAAAHDITKRIHLDQVLQDKNTELENARVVADKANLAKSEFLSSMSHELRSPLNAILGFAQLLESGSPLPTPNQKASVDQILHGGWYLLELINEILDLTLIESGRMSLSLEPISLAEVLSDCQALIEPQAQKNGIVMHFPQADIPYFINADRTRMKQVLINLLSNAIKYNSVLGTIEVTCRVLNAERLRISVQDTGEGLPPEKIAQLFQPFNRLGQEVGTEEGTGIGLVVSKRLVELMGGEIGATSIVGVGSVFWVELNRADALQLAPATDKLVAPIQARVPHGAARRTLLYIEDNRANMQLVEQLIARRPDMRLLSAWDGTQGIALARAHRPEVIMMDINLPGISGIQALKILREDPETAHIPVLAISANAMPRDIEKGLEAGFIRYLTKPIDVNKFIEALDLALSFAETGLNDTLPRQEQHK